MRISSCKAMQIAAEHQNTIKALSERRVEITKRFLVGLGTAYRKQIFRPKRMGKKAT